MSAKCWQHFLCNQKEVKHCCANKQMTRIVYTSFICYIFRHTYICIKIYCICIYSVHVVYIVHTWVRKRNKNNLLCFEVNTHWGGVYGNVIRNIYKKHMYTHTYIYREASIQSSLENSQGTRNIPKKCAYSFVYFGLSVLISFTKQTAV